MENQNLARVGKWAISPRWEPTLNWPEKPRWPLELH
jgi:hypothetical protein